MKRVLWATFLQNLRCRWRLGHGHPRRRVRTSLLLGGVVLLHVAVLLGWRPAPGENVGLAGVIGCAAAAYLFARGARGLMSLMDSATDLHMRKMAPFSQLAVPAGTLLGAWVYAVIEVLPLASAAVLALVLSGQPQALTGYVALPLLGLPAAALGHLSAAVSLRCIGRSLTRLVVRILQYAAPAAPLYAAVAGMDITGLFGWWAIRGRPAAAGFLTVLALGPLLAWLAALSTPAGETVAAGGARRTPEGVTLNPGGFRSLLRKELRLIVRDPRTWARFVGMPIAVVPTVWIMLSAVPMLAAVALGVIGAALTGLSADVLTRSEAERVPVLRLSLTPLSRLVAAKTAATLPLVVLVAAGGGLYLLSQGVPHAPVLIAAGSATGAFSAWFSAQDRFRMFTTPNTFLNWVGYFLWLLVFLMAFVGVLGHIQSGPAVGVVFLVLTCPLAAGAVLIIRRARW